MSEERFVIDYDLEELEEENVKLRAKIEEQQATIEQLQEKINMEYAEQIVKENQKLRIAKNDLRIENEQLKKENKRLKERNDELEDELEESSAFIIEQREENKQLQQELRGMGICLN